ncbi:hypothetical protein SLG_36520 [Sphingobium sp. SYK-6]|uniref:hypothetical protein n=1 Tax=Sphingobium sp. (strain NBRC 103272 / SYK-6) TaxID=627192 RepID=UPI0002277D41|nr:hypothetical protein [Sphingobium sp. SYK-6]BAK68327.1 hypothetical protein SLG_36520 [Sphingobium sp. SYK-6]
MVDTFSLLLTHGLILLACWRLLGRNDLDDESGGETRDLLGRPRETRDRHDA